MDILAFLRDMICLGGFLLILNTGLFGGYNNYECAVGVILNSATFFETCITKKSEIQCFVAKNFRLSFWMI